MPLPKPSDKEEKDEFVSRCMSEIKTEFPDQDKRLAVCFSQWEDKDKKKEDSITMDTIERRMWPNAEFRLDGQGNKRKIIGHAALFNSPSEEMGFFGHSFREQIAPGAFRESIKRDDIRALWNHDPNFPLGRNRSGTLILNEDDKGLYFEVSPPETQWAKDLMVSIERGDVSQNSFGFLINKKGDEWNDDNSIRTLKSVRLFDISPVTYPAYPETEVFVRSRGNVYVSGIDRIIQHFDQNPHVVVVPSDPDSKPKTVEPDPTPLISQEVEIKLNEIMKRRFKT
jgi:hypothetical protein